VDEYSFRVEQRGELAGLRRLRAFTMPDCHCLVKDFKQAKKEFMKRMKLAQEVQKGIGFDLKKDFEYAIRVTDDFFKDHKDIVLDLVKEWGSRTFVNPPYGREIGKWVKKSYEESLKGKIVVMLMPVRTDTNYFHNYILGKAEVRFIKGRLRFRGFSKKQNKIVDNEPASFPCMTIIFQDQLLR